MSGPRCRTCGDTGRLAALGAMIGAPPLPCPDCAAVREHERAELAQETQRGRDAAREARAASDALTPAERAERGARVRAQRAGDELARIAADAAQIPDADVRAADAAAWRATLAEARERGAGGAA